jgi:RimJ/RimL family protein N-acetyltransferase
MILDLVTPRLRLRPFVPADLPEVSRVFGDADHGVDRDQRAEWLAWSALSYRWLDRLHQPPFGDYAMVDRQTNAMVGACGFAPCLAPFGQLDWHSGAPSPARHTFEVGIYYHVDPTQRRRGYATEAARALVEHGREHLLLARIVATTTYDNHGSLGVIAKLGMRLLRNRLPDPPWLQAVGIIDFQ